MIILIKKFIVHVLIQLRVNTKGISINSLSPLGAKNKDVTNAVFTLKRLPR